MKQKKGFTLAELLIALGILGVITTLVIPKVLMGQQNSKYKSIAKETMGMISETYEIVKLKKGQSPLIGQKDFIPYLNYVRRDTVFGNCSVGSVTCLILHNGALLHIPHDDGIRRFAGITSTHALNFTLYPDSGKLSGPGAVAPLGIILTYPGAIKTKATMEPGTGDSYGTFVPQGDPVWFNWK